MTEGAREQDRGVGGVSHRATAWLAWFLWVLGVTLAVLAVLLALYTPPFPDDASAWGALLAVSLLAYPTVGALIASRRPRNLVGWLLCGVGLLFGMQGFAVAYAGYALSVQPGLVPGEKIALWVSGWFYFPMVFLAAALMILLFPDGRLPNRSFRAAPWVALGGGVLWTLWLATVKGPALWFYSTGRNPFFVGGILGDTLEVLGRLGAALLLLIWVASVIGVFARLGSSRGEERQQIKWFAYAAAVLLACFFLAPLIARL